ncbi:hypothetical protein [Nereida ignava]|uniref:hypothetical protein n=1 Tax=Nereida ignava TaxID=282199 RepID=UPI0030FB9F88
MISWFALDLQRCVATGHALVFVSAPSATEPEMWSFALRWAGVVLLLAHSVGGQDCCNIVSIKLHGADAPSVLANSLVGGYKRQEDAIGSSLYVWSGQTNNNLQIRQTEVDGPFKITGAFQKDPNTGAQIVLAQTRTNSIHCPANANSGVRDWVDAIGNNVPIEVHCVLPRQQRQSEELDNQFDNDGSGNDGPPTPSPTTPSITLSLVEPAATDNTLNNVGLGLAVGSGVVLVVGASYAAYLAWGGLLFV